MLILLSGCVSINGDQIIHQAIKAQAIYDSADEGLSNFLSNLSGRKVLIRMIGFSDRLEEYRNVDEGLLIENFIEGELIRAGGQIVKDGEKSDVELRVVNLMLGTLEWATPKLFSFIVNHLDIKYVLKMDLAIYNKKTNSISAEKTIYSEAYFRETRVFGVFGPIYDSSSLELLKIISSEPVGQPKNIGELYNKGTSLYRSGNYIEAWHVLQSLEKIEFDYKRTRRVLLNIVDRLNVKDHIALVEYHIDKGMDYHLENQLDDAVFEYQKALMLEPENPKASRELERVLDEMEIR
ncbi:MAG: tetratricopeptide repeat protein [Elusimicrobia bacterium]|nr:tetratricopeptide repeat protein [Elusimicrobiota bacterium]